MTNTLRIFLIGNFRFQSTTSIHVEPHHFQKGFTLLGHDVLPFSFRDVMGHRFGKASLFDRRKPRQRAAEVMVDAIKHYHPDIVMIQAMKLFGPDTVQAMRDAAPKAIFIGRDGDPFPESVRHRVEIGGAMDFVIATNAGRFLKTYKDAGTPVCAFIPHPCDPSIQRPYDVGPEYRSDIFWAGEAGDPNRRHGDDYDPDRYAIVSRLAAMPNARVHGAMGRPGIEGMDHLFAIAGAKICPSIGRVNDMAGYFTDRAINALAGGSFVLAKRVPDSDALFQESVHLKYFDSAEEFFELAQWYLNHEEERLAIAQAGMARVYDQLNCTRICQHILDLIHTGSYDAPWQHVLA